MKNVRNVFEAILKYGHDEDFMPLESDEFQPTDAPAGSPEKIDILRNGSNWACRCGTSGIGWTTPA